MSETDLSDEACWPWLRVYASQRPLYGLVLDTWQECRRRANEAYRTNEIKWMNIVSKMRQDFENERREAFEAGYLMRKKMPPLTPDEAYRAFLQERERK